MTSVCNVDEVTYVVIDHDNGGRKIRCSHVFGNRRSNHQSLDYFRNDLGSVTTQRLSCSCVFVNCDGDAGRGLPY